MSYLLDEKLGGDSDRGAGCAKCWAQWREVSIGGAIALGFS